MSVCVHACRPLSAGNGSKDLQINRFERADAGTRTPDPIITSDVLCQLSYVGECGVVSGRGGTG